MTRFPAFDGKEVIDVLKGYGFIIVMRENCDGGILGKPLRAES